MSIIPNDYHGRLSRCVASPDADEALRLISIVTAAKLAGNARGFEVDLAKLTAIAEGRPQGLAKGFNPRRADLGHLVKDMPLPAPLQARANATIAMIKAAETPREIELAKAAGEALVTDLNTHAAFKGATDRRLGKSIVEGLAAR